MALLIVDDNPTVRRLIAKIVADLVDDIRECSDGAEALVAYQQCHPDMTLMDIEMDKAARHTDWSSLDLRPEQVRYAISDVTLLLPLMDRLEDMLDREARKDLARQCFKVIPVMALLDLLGYEQLFEH